MGVRMPSRKAAADPTAQLKRRRGAPALRRAAAARGFPGGFLAEEALPGAALDLIAGGEVLEPDDRVAAPCVTPWGLGLAHGYGKRCSGGDAGGRETELVRLPPGTGSLTRP